MRQSKITLLIVTVAFIGGIFLALRVSNPTLAQAAPAVQELQGSLAPGQIDVFRIAGLKQGQILTAFVETTSGNLDPALGILPVDENLSATYESFKKDVAELVASSPAPLLDLPALRDQYFLSWDDDSGPGYSAALEFMIPSDGDYYLIFIFNEIAAHAQGAFYHDNEVDTVVDIGGQDAKFIRLEKGRVIDSCMNTVCSAGTGSFLAEQLQLLGINDIRRFGQMAFDSHRLVELGQYCAVFISERIDDAKRRGATLEEITAGLYYSIILNYNNRVKGLRDYGQKIFLQGKPAENLSLACAMAKATGRKIVVPPSPGSMGALGIAILAKKEFGNGLSKQPSLGYTGGLKGCEKKAGIERGELEGVDWIFRRPTLG